MMKRYKRDHWTELCRERFPHLRSASGSGSYGVITPASAYLFRTPNKTLVALAKLNRGRT